MGRGVCDEGCLPLAVCVILEAEPPAVVKPLGTELAPHLTNYEIISLYGLKSHTLAMVYITVTDN